METTEEILNKLIERIGWHKQQAVSCEEQRRFWVKMGMFTLADACKRYGEKNRKILEEISKRLEAAIKG